MTEQHEYGSAVLAEQSLVNTKYPLTGVTLSQFTSPFGGTLQKIKLRLRRKMNLHHVPSLKQHGLQKNNLYSTLH